MSSTAIEDKFAINYYHWAADQWSREINERFAFLNTVGNAEAARIIGILKPLSTTEAMRVARALLKRTHRKAMTALGEPLTAEEAALLQKMDERRRNEMFRQQLTATFRRKEDKPDRGRRRAQLLAELTRSLTPVLGRPKRASGSTYTVETPAGDWTIITMLDMGGRSDLNYYHDIPIGSKDGHYLSRLISALCWLGINQTSWVGLAEEQVPAVADFVASAAKRFLDAAPLLLPKPVE